ncbi:MAG: small GTP-binding protein [Arenicella sp.]|jgi:small GTP-binding protein
MRKKKICMVGDFSVGKTSITQKFVNNVFSEKYLTTIGVKIDTATVGEDKLIVWDVAGRDSLSPINASYLVGASGVILVADGSRSSTVGVLLEIWQTVTNRIGSVPVVVALNKADLDGWQIDDHSRALLDQQGWDVFATSAKDGKNVEAVFKKLVEIMNCKES